ncbi:OmpA family protein [Hydrogenophaga sp. BPS33]|uniref:OmpA family protein n=1 Tax=Hydrogenophaga sp. BPS33 TaxID=2651974 RepID=UPI00135BFF74|nr:OmpA family protein [Hydrogenophaga sp. BPS33]
MNECTEYLRAVFKICKDGIIERRSRIAIGRIVGTQRGEIEMQKFSSRLRMVVCAGMLLLLTACASKMPASYVVLVPDPDGAVGQVMVTGAQGQQVLTRAGQVAGIDGREVKTELQPAQFNADFSDAKAAQPAPPEHFMLYFFTGGARLTAESERQFAEILNRVRARGADAVVELVVIGHTDTVGSADDNLVLSAQRAQAVADRLRASGLKYSALTLESHGKTNPLVPTRDGVAEPRNRRVQVTIR